MGDLSDEKVIDTTTASSASTQHDVQPQSQGLSRTTSHASSVSTSSASSASIESNPLEPLERALTGTSELPEEREARISKTRTATSIGTTGSRPPDFEVDFSEEDGDNPLTWPFWYRGFIIGACSFATWSVVVYSTAYTSGISEMMEEFDASESIVTLGVTMYLLGLAIGSLILAPLSEIYGRRPVYAITMFLYFILILPGALSKTLSGVIIGRFFGAIAGSAMIANAPGTIADISDESYRALAFSIWSIGPLNGPVTGPILGGFISQYLGWRWTAWVCMIIAGVGWIVMSLAKETYAPAILRAKAAKMRKETDDERWWSRYDTKSDFTETLKINLSRPFILLFTEPILWFWDLYISVVYGILYLCFVAYPIIFTETRGWSLGFSGLAFCGIGVGATMVIVAEPLIRKLINSHPKDPETGRVKPEASVSIICICAVLAPVGQLIFSWTSLPANIHWIVSILAGVPFGIGNTGIFIYASNYLAGSYGIYSASALAGNTVIRSIFGGTLPLAGDAMYTALTPQWAGTLLGLLEVVLIPIPFVFYRYGEKIRMRSPLIRKMREDQERNAKRAKKRAAAAAAVDTAEKKDDADVEKGLDVIPEVKTAEAGGETV